MKIEVLSTPQADDQRAIVQLAAAAEAEDSVPPFSEQPLLDLAAARETQRQVVIRDLEEGGVIGAALIDMVGASVELATHPQRRRSGVGSALLTAVRGELGERSFAVWAHGDLEGARGFADARGGKVERTLLCLGRSLNDTDDDDLAPVERDDVELTTFVPGDDDADLLRVNAAAFSWHPEQGRFSQEELDQRKSAPWFNAKYLRLARTDGQINSFVWVKPPIGSEESAELYVIGVHPDAQGRGLGQYLTREALSLARNTGARRMILWTEDTNEAALRTYAATGFSEDLRDVQYTFA